IDAEKKLLYRFVAEKSDDLNTWRDNSFGTGLYVAPSLTWNVSSATSATLQAEYRDSRTSFDRGLVAPNKNAALVAPLTTSYQEPGDFQQEKGSSVSLSAYHWLTDAVKWNFSGRRVDSD